MCFTIQIDRQKVKPANKDLICYKSVYFNLKSTNKKPIILTPRFEYNKFKYELGVLHHIKDTNNIDTLHDLSKPDHLKTSYVSRGAFHSYSTISTLFSRSKSRFKYSRSNLLLIPVQCTIPKGSLYLYNSTNQEYVSNQIRIDSILLSSANKFFVPSYRMGYCSHLDILTAKLKSRQDIKLYY